MQKLLYIQPTVLKTVKSLLRIPAWTFLAVQKRLFSAVGVVKKTCTSPAGGVYNDVEEFKQSTSSF